MNDEVLTRLDNIEKVFSHGDKPLNFKEAAEYLSSSKSYLYKITSRRLIPFYKPLGKKIYFKRQDLEAFLLSNQVKTKEQIERAGIKHVALNGRR